MLQTLAYVLSSTPGGEYDRRYSLYCEKFGKIVATAKGIRKIQAKLAGHLEPPHLVWVGIVEGKKNGADGRPHWQLAQALEKEDFVFIRNDPVALKEVLKSGLIFDELVQEPERDIALWQLWNEFLQEAEVLTQNGQGSRVSFLVPQFLLRLLGILGLCPDSLHCSACGKELQKQGFFANPVTSQGDLYGASREFFCVACSPDVSKNAKMPPEVFQVLGEVLAGKWVGSSTVELEISQITQAYLNRARQFML